MPNEQKSSALLEAQVALYADSHLEHDYPGRERALLQNIGDVAAFSDAAPEHVDYPRTIAKKDFVDGNIVELAAKGTPTDLFINEEYVEFYKDAHNREISRRIASLIDTYPKLAPTLDSLSMLGLTLEQARQHPNFLDHGGSQMAFAFEAEVDGKAKQLVALVDQNPDSAYSHSKANGRAIVLAMSKQLDGFEQGVAVSYDPPVVISERAPGKQLFNMNHLERTAIPEAHWEKLRQNIQYAVERGIQIDFNTDNFLYDTDKGFTVIDCRTARKDVPAVEQLQRTAANLAHFHYRVTHEAQISRN